MNYTEIEAKVRAATNDEAWGPTGKLHVTFNIVLLLKPILTLITTFLGALMQEIAHATFTFEHFPEVMTMLWKRMLQDNKSNWRRTYKVSIICII